MKAQKSLHLTEEQIRRIDELAKKEERSFAAMVRIILEKGLAHYEEKQV